MYIVLVLNVLHYNTAVQVLVCAVVQIVLVLHVLHYSTAVQVAVCAVIQIVLVLHVLHYTLQYMPVAECAVIERHRHL